MHLTLRLRFPLIEYRFADNRARHDGRQEARMRLVHDEKHRFVRQLRHPQAHRYSSFLSRRSLNTLKLPLMCYCTQQMRGMYESSQ